MVWIVFSFHFFASVISRYDAFIFLRKRSQLPCLLLTGNTLPYIAVPRSAPVHLQGSAVNSTAIFLQWQPPLLTDQNGVIRSYLINITVVETGTTLQLTSQTTARNISGLHPYYTFFFCITMAATCFTLSHCSPNQCTSTPPRQCSKFNNHPTPVGTSSIS